MEPILLVSDEAQRVAKIVGPRFPQLEFLLVTNAQEVLAALARHRPEIAFSIKHSGFPPAAHRPLVDCPSMRWVHVGGSGFEHFVPWDSSRLVLTNSVGVLAPFLAEMTIGAMLHLTLGLNHYVVQQQRRIWQPRPFRPLVDRTLLVIGLGAIGTQVARLAKALGMRVIAVRRSSQLHGDVDEVFGADGLPQALSLADVVSVHVRANEQTRGMFDASAFAAMRPGAIFMNTSRGSVVEETALVEALRNKHLGGAYLDVFAAEPLPTDSALWAMSNVLITPHTADQTIDYPERFASLFADNLARWLAGEPLINQIPNP